MTKRSILDVAAILDPPLPLFKVLIASSTSFSRDVQIVHRILHRHFQDPRL